MAERTLTVSMDKMFEFLCEHVYDCYYRDINRNYIMANHQTGDYLMAALHFPDLTATLGRHLLYRVDTTFRAVPQQTSRLWFGKGYGLGNPLPSLNPGTQYIKIPLYVRVPFYLELYESRADEPGADYTLHEIHVTGGDETSAKNKSEFTYNVLKNQVVLIDADSAPNKIYTTLLNGSAPYLTIYYDDTEVVSRYLSSVTGIKSGYWNPRYAHNIGWALSVLSTNVYRALDEVIRPVTTHIYWKESGGSWNTINVPSRASSYDVPANTFPTGKTIEWYLSVTDEDGITTTSSTYTVTTDDSTSTAEPTAPVNSIEIGNQPITFTWTVTNPSGEAPSRVKAEWATDPDNGPWTSLFDESSAIYSYTAPANTFPGGNIYWRITSYNADSEAGPTSDPAVFSCIAPPAPPSGLVATSAPFATVSWQSAVQTAFEVIVDGKTAAKKFGIGVYSYQLEEPLEDGPHSFGVRIQGPYGYWSTYAMTSVVTENAGTGNLGLAGKFDVDASLSWIFESESTADAFRVYRDGVMIARTLNDYFLDRFVLGEHSYTVLAELAGGHYCKSDVVVGTMKSGVTRIAPAAGGDWLELALSENSSGLQSFEWSKSVTMRHYAGAIYPVAEFSPYEDRTATYDCAFKTSEEAAAFERLRGQIVILKSRRGEVVIGPLSAVSKSVGDFYLSYHFSVSQVHWEDFIDDTDS